MIMSNLIFLSSEFLKLLDGSLTDHLTRKLNESRKFYGTQN